MKIFVRLFSKFLQQQKKEAISVERYCFSCCSIKKSVSVFHMEYQAHGSIEDFFIQKWQSRLDLVWKSSGICKNAC